MKLNPRGRRWAGYPSRPDDGGGCERLVVRRGDPIESLPHRQRVTLVDVKVAEHEYLAPHVEHRVVAALQ